MPKVKKKSISSMKHEIVDVALSNGVQTVYISDIMRSLEAADIITYSKIFSKLKTKSSSQKFLQGLNAYDKDGELLEPYKVEGD